MTIYRRIIFTLLISCAGIGTLLGQRKIPLSFTPKIGVNFTDLIISQPSVDATLSKMGWNVGLDARYGNRFAVNAGLHFFRLGSAFKMRAEDTPESVTASQFKFPVGLSYRILKVDYFKLWVKADAVLNTTIRVVNGDPSRRLTGYPKTGFSSRMGIGMDLGRLNIEVNYERSHTELLREIVFAHNELFSITLGIRI